MNSFWLFFRCGCASRNSERHRPGEQGLFYLTLTFALPLALLTSSCSDRINSTAQASNPPPTWSWTAYPLTTQMRLGLVSGRVLPKTSFTMLAPLAGPLRLYVKQQQTNLPAGFVWAEFQPKILAAEAAVLEETKTKVAEKEHLFFELELPRQRLRLENDMDEARRQIALLELLTAHPEAAPAAAKITGLKEPSLRPETVARARKQLKLLEENYRLLCETNPAVLGTDLQAQRSEIKQRELDLERRQGQTRFAMPFAGQLNISLPLVQGVSDYPVNLGQELGVIRDVSTILLRIPLADPAWSSLPAERLSAVLTLSDGSRRQTRYSFKRIERTQMREEIVYYFEFPPEAASASSRLVGAEVSCELCLTLAQPAHVIPKLALVLQAPAAFQNRKWDEGLAQISPGSRVLVEGQTDLAIVTP